MHRHDPLGKGVPVPRPLPPAGPPWARTLALARCLENQIARAAYEDEDLLGQGVRAPTLGGVHPWGSPGVESSTAQNGTTWYLLVGLEMHKHELLMKMRTCLTKVFGLQHWEAFTLGVAREWNLPQHRTVLHGTC